MVLPSHWASKDDQQAILKLPLRPEIAEKDDPRWKRMIDGIFKGKKVADLRDETVSLFEAFLKYLISEITFYPVPLSKEFTPLQRIILFMRLPGVTKEPVGALEPIDVKKIHETV